MKYIEVKKRRWVMPAAIVFLAVMLVLTFFSNTIMNRSLPEVAARYTSSGTITARIRGFGTVSANEIFEVEISQTRLVREVPVKLGDEVNIGDTLVVFDGDISEDLKNAQNELSSKESELEVLLLELSKGNDAVASAARAVQSARNSLTDAQRILSGLNYNEAAYNAALAADNQAQAALQSAQAIVNTKQYDFDVADAELQALNDAIDLGAVVDPAVLAAAELKVADAQSALRFAIATRDAASSNALLTAAALASQGSRDAWLSANSAVRDAQLNLDERNADLTRIQNDNNIASSLESIQVRDLRKVIEDLQKEVDRLEDDGGSSEIKALVAGIVRSVNVSPGSNAAADETLMTIENTSRGYSLSLEVTAEQARRVSVGDQAEVDRGWWWGGEEIKATLMNIRNNPQNPATGRILTFSITGSVENGDQLNLIMNQRSENYNVIVPTSAIRTDTNGDFVLLVDSRSSPLGNRYIATRIDINILAADDTNTAVSGGLTSWDFVITHSSAPINPGDQIRLVDNP